MTSYKTLYTDLAKPKSGAPPPFRFFRLFVCLFVCFFCFFFAGSY